MIIVDKALEKRHQDRKPVRVGLVGAGFIGRGVAHQTIDSLYVSDLYALTIPGGWAPDKLRRYAIVTDLVRQMYEAQKLIGVICHGGLVAISAGIVKGHCATGSLGIKDDLVNAGASWVDEPAFRDANLVWGRVVAEIPDFCRELVKALTE